MMHDMLHMTICFLFSMDAIGFESQSLLIIEQAVSLLISKELRRTLLVSRKHKCGCGDTLIREN